MLLRGTNLHKGQMTAMDERSPMERKKVKIVGKKKVIRRNTGLKYRLVEGYQVCQAPHSHQFCDCQPLGLNRCQTMQQSVSLWIYRVRDNCKCQELRDCS